MTSRDDLAVVCRVFEQLDREGAHLCVNAELEDVCTFCDHYSPHHEPDCIWVRARALLGLTERPLGFTEPA